MTGIVEVTTTLETSEQAQDLARKLVQDRLAACVQVTGPVHSYYRWKGEVCDSTEFRCTVKTSHQLLSEVMDCVRDAHPYDLPEILATEVKASCDAYAEWLHAQLKA